MSQAELARHMSTHGWPYYAQTVHRIESGQRKVSIGEANSLAYVLKTSIAQLTWPGPGARAAGQLRRETRRVREAFDQIVEWTTAFLTAKGDLSGVLTRFDKGLYDLSQVDDYAKREILELGKRAAGEVSREPEAAVILGRDIYQEARDRGLDQQMADLEQAARGGKRILPKETPGSPRTPLIIDPILSKYQERQAAPEVPVDPQQ